MTAKTRLGYEGYGVRRIVSFAGKTQTSTITGTFAASENPDIVAFLGTSGGRLWIAATIQSETWTPATIQAETWTPK